jgi:phage shock protein PspC (stress-responsive transcriptional regulator)
MNKILNINLGGYPFTIDDDAYEHLSEYLNTIHNHFQDSEGYEEITADIEARMAELFQETTENRPIVTLQAVKDAIAIMGTPEEFGAEAVADEPMTKKTKTKRTTNKSGIKTGKRLFRNPDDEVVGGVASGVAAYLGIQEPLWVRLGFLVIAFGMGFGVLFYIVLWAILPKAESASDRLAMRGEPINVDNIGKIIEEEIDIFTEKMTGLGDDLKDEFDTKKKSFTSSGTTGTAREAVGSVKLAVTSGLRVLGKTIKLVVKTILNIWKPIFFIVGVGLIIAFAVGWIASLIGIFLGFPFLNFILHGNSAFNASIVSMNILFVIGIPLVAMILLVLRIFMGSHIKPVWKTGLWAFFAANLLCLFVNAMFTVKDFEHSNEINQVTRAGFVEGDTLSIDFLSNPYDDAWVTFDEFKISGNKLINEDIYLYIEKSDNEDFKLEQRTFSRGKSRELATELANSIEYDFEIKDDQLIFPAHFAIEQPTKYRAQKINFYLKVPEGKYIKFKHSTNEAIRKMEVDASKDHPDYGRYAHWWHEENDREQIWKMEENGLICPDYLTQNKSDSTYDFKNFKVLTVEGAMKVTVEKGDEFAIRLEGRNKNVKNVEVTQFGETVDFQYNRDRHHDHNGNGVHLFVTMPYLKKLAVENTKDVRVQGFVQDAMTISSEMRDNQIKAFVEVENLTIKQIKYHKLDLRGKGKYLNLSMDENADIDAEHYTVSVADVKAVNRNGLKLMVTDTLRKHVSPGSDLILDGNPLVIDLRDENRD